MRNKKNSYFIRYTVGEGELMWAFDCIIEPGTCASYIMGTIMINEVLKHHSDKKRTDVKFYSICLLNSEPD